MRWTCSLAILLLGGCTETRILTPPLMSRIPGAVTSGPTDDGQVVGDEQVMAAPEPSLIENPDGTKTMISRNGRQLMLNMIKCFDDELPDLFVKDVLCTVTRAEYAERGLDPVQAYHTLRKRREDIMLLLERIPGVERTPGVLVKTVGRNIFRIEITGSFARGLAYTGVDIMFEGGNYRLRWFLGK